ncbi:MAG: TIGR00645 family protein [Gammaproteobacteria bacterium HGW-Gammaproteobacteria-1]|nr:MAG: TIGR00645 family protein [Gammaproteobacteria bacterium HGW-Gammaproteobacteria-1]
MKRLEHGIEMLVFNSRWLLAPFYIGLVGGIGMLLVKFGQEFFHLLPHVLEYKEADVILALLTLVDMSLVANLLLIIVFSGYENFVSKINTEGHEDRPDWMGKVDFSGLKAKVIASIVAISAIELLKAFVHIGSGGPGAETAVWGWTEQDKALAWKVVIHVVLVISGVLFAVMDKIGGGHGAGGDSH